MYTVVKALDLNDFKKIMREVFVIIEELACESVLLRGQLVPL